MKQVEQNYIREIIAKEIEAIQNIPVDERLETALDIIQNAVHNNGGKLVVSGMGKAGQIGHNMSTTFSSTGTPSVFLHPSEAQHGDLGILQEKDALLLISNSGKTREVLELVNLARNLFPSIQIIALCGSAQNELSEQADVCIDTGNPSEVGPLGLAPTTSTTCMTVIGDALVSCMMTRIDFSKEEYAKRHHSGYLGQKARS